MEENKKCIFCEMAEGKMQPLGEAKIFEDENYLAWLSPFPNTEGFSVVIPKAHFGGDVLAMPDEELKEFVIVAKKVSQMLTNYFEDVGRVGLIMEGTGIDHAHIKLFPMHGTEYLKGGKWKRCSSGEYNKYFEKYEGYVSSHDSLQADFPKLQKLAEGIRGKNKK
jgi:diadenosine tetraphosphate (Ap4A) HIT family hydrolase